METNNNIKMENDTFCKICGNPQDSTKATLRKKVTFPKLHRKPK
jgi:hypothetical protein